MTNTPEPIWRKSSRSNGAGNCVEVATNLLEQTGEVLVRDSKHPEVAPFAFTRPEWVAFLEGVDLGEFKL